MLKTKWKIHVRKTSPVLAKPCVCSPGCCFILHVHEKKGNNRTKIEEKVMGGK